MTVTCSSSWPIAGLTALQPPAAAGASPPAAFGEGVASIEPPAAAPGSVVKTQPVPGEGMPAGIGPLGQLGTVKVAPGKWRMAVQVTPTLVGSSAVVPFGEQLLVLLKGMPYRVAVWAASRAAFP